ncbi:MAG TPA: response regulator transcription factor [Polyangiaceae bacterium]|nr:response regulator transcription factor [Polyangiaceae bacterium]
MRILVVDDELEMRELLGRNLGRAHGVKSVGTCKEAVASLAHARFDVLILDVMLPDGSGIDLCGKLRSEGVEAPILLLTARGEVRSRVAGLDAGADDYLAKPFALSELRARVAALGRRGPIRRDRAVVIGALVVDLEGRRVRVDGRALPLTARELAIVDLLATRRGKVVPREELIESVWGEVTDSARASLEVLIARIRQKLGDCASLLQTVRGVGYLLGVD